MLLELWKDADQGLPEVGCQEEGGWVGGGDLRAALSLKP